MGSASTWWLRRRARRRRNGRRRGGTGQGQHGSQCNWPGHGRIRKVAGRCCAVHCIAARHRAGQPQHQHGAQHERAVALHHRGRTWRSAGGQSTLQPTGKHRVPNAEGQAAAGCALGCIRPGAGLQCTKCSTASRCTIRGTPIDSRCADPPTSARAATRKAAAMLEASVHCQAPSQRTQQQPSQGARREASTSTAAWAHTTAVGSEQSRRPRRVHTIGAAIGTWPDTAIDSEVHTARSEVWRQFGGRGVWPQRPFQVFKGRGVWRQKASTNLDARTPFGQHPTEGHDRDDSKPPWATPRCVFLRPVGVHHRVAGKHMFYCSLQVYTTKSLVKTCFPTARRCVGIGFTAEPPWATPQRRHALSTLLKISL